MDVHWKHVPEEEPNRSLHFKLCLKSKFFGAFHSQFFPLIGPIILPRPLRLLYPTIQNIRLVPMGLSYHNAVFRPH